MEEVLYTFIRLDNIDLALNRGLLKTRTVNKAIQPLGNSRPVTTTVDVMREYIFRRLAGKVCLSAKPR